MWKIQLFRIFYSTTYTILFFILVGLLLVTPADAIRQALANRQVYNIFVIAGIYLLTLIAALLIYASRLYTNRSVLAGIPKAWIPIEKGDVGSRVRHMIADGLNQAARVAWEAKPKDVRLHDNVINGMRHGHGNISIAEPNAEKTEDRQARRGVMERLNRRRTNADPVDEGSAQARPWPPWGRIEHAGWTSPSTSDLPNLQFETVIWELPYLVEAKAVALAPTDPPSSPTRTLVGPSAGPLPDARAVELLQRPATMGLRDYLRHLASLDVLGDGANSARFLAQYEHARFSTQQLTEEAFREMMRSFADLLRGMKQLDEAWLGMVDSEADDERDPLDFGSTSEFTTDDEDGAEEFFTSKEGNGTGTPSFYSASQGSKGSLAASEDTIRTVHRASAAASASASHSASRRRRAAEHGMASASTSASSAGRRRPPALRSASSSSSIAQRHRPPYAASQHSTTSTASVGSVIRLARSDEQIDLPYTILTGNAPT